MHTIRAYHAELQVPLRGGLPFAAAAARLAWRFCTMLENPLEKNDMMNDV